jgi:spore coat polysaccharide biosynthesis protein SpsF
MGTCLKDRIVATIECRMTSSRLSGKVMLEAIRGKSMLEVMVERVKQVPQIDDIVLATTINRADDVIERLAVRLGIGCFRGSEDDVLSRVLGAAEKFKADTIVELTGDCPIIDPEIVSQIIDCYLSNDCDYASNCEPNTYPVGMETQVFSLKSLRIADKKGKTSQDREHVSWYIRKRPDVFRHLTLIAPASLKHPEIEVTLDEKQDYELIRKVIAKLYPRNKYFSCYDIVKLCLKHPELLRINRSVKRKYD